MRVTLPSLETLFSLSGGSSDVSKHLQHNFQLWRWINGAVGILKDETLAFDTQQDYWYRTDRRIVAAYLHRRLRESCYPAADLRALAQHLFRHFEGAVPEEPHRHRRGLTRHAANSLRSPPMRRLGAPPRSG